jgi:EAL domain-containing protein (putative c-di-GMP-specific phosphodiesterase class I)
MTDPDDAIIAEAIIALGRSLRLNVVAEGMETKAQLDFLNALNCDEAQGFYFSKPLLAAEFIEYCQEQNQKTEVEPIKLSA